MNQRAEDQRVAEAIAQEDLWRANKGERAQRQAHLLACSGCAVCWGWKSESGQLRAPARDPAFTLPAHSSLLDSLRQPVPFWWTVLTAAGVAGLVAFVTFALEIKP